MRAARVPLSGWGNYRKELCEAYRPERLADLGRVVTDGPASVIARGLGRSYGDSAVNPAGVVLCERLNRFLDFDAENGIITCEPGVNYKDLIATFLPRGWFPFVSPGTQFVTVGGAIAADVHGKNHHVDGTFGKHVIEVELLLPSGETVRCSRESDPELFRATLGGMGLTGVITQAKFHLMKVPSAYTRVEYRRARNLDAVLELLSADEAKHRFSVAWIDCLAVGEDLGRSVLMSGDFAEPGDLPADVRNIPYVVAPRRTRSIPINFPGFALNRLSVKLFNKLYYGKHDDETRIVDYESFFYPLDSVLQWNRMYGKRGFIQYQALFPTASSRQGLTELLTVLSSEGAASFLAVLKSTGQQGEGLLSYPFKGHTLALDIPNRSGLGDLVAKLDTIVARHAGRLYLAKDAVMSRELFEGMYPDLPQFKSVRQRVDPAGKLASDQARRLGLA